ncbi:MAG: C4-dicarboxylate ABC transporter substrate-binding protein [Proteobacteria bacterium]|nr:C4-dicarboxylate ABC transporter substrate-binding protein [Pseudomonadota bacterium]MCP4983851.1 C4-dicarboxylate ABC transporter substrate-binding protein [Gammaproteobacteria bacterium]
MKKISTVCLLLAAVMFLPQWALAETTLRISLQLPIKHHLGQNLLNFKNEVEQESGGDLKIEIYPSAQLYVDKEVPQAVSSGAIEMGVAPTTRFAGTIPAIDIFYVPFMFTNSDKVRKATAAGSPIRGPLDEAILKTGARPLWWQAFGGAILLSRGAPIKRPEDMVGKKVRVFGKTIGEFVKAAGGAPTLMSGSKQFLAYQRGTVDAGTTGLTAIPSRKLHQVMEYVTLTNHADIEFVVLINEKVWQGLSSTQQAIINKAARRVEKELRDKMGRLEEEALEFARSKMTVVPISNDDLASWKKATSSVVDTYIRNAGPLGKQLVEAAGNL